MSRWITLLAVIYWSCSAALAQRCVENIVPSTSIQDYLINSDGTVTDKRHQIIWNRCATGQTWKNDSCIGEAVLMDWQQAKKLANEYKNKTSNNWRLPTVHELSKITELSCENPAINLHLFPSAPSLHFWTGVEFKNDHNNAWQVYFGTGENHIAKKSTKAAVRLVRSIDNGNF